MTVGFATLERLLVVLFGLSETQRGALGGRFKYIQRQGGLAQPGRRGRVRYGVEDILKAALTFELVDLGCAPTRAVRIVRTHWAAVRVNLAHAWRDVGARATGKSTERLLWAVVPHALGELGAGEAMGDVDVADRAGEIDAKEALDWMPGHALAGDRHALFVNLPRLLAACDEAFAVVALDRQKPFRAALDRFATEYSAERAG